MTKKEFKLNYEPDFVPTLFDINKSFEVLETKRYKGIKDEIKTRMVIFTNYILGRKSVLLIGQRGSGKTNLIDICTLYCPKTYEINLASEKADVRDSEGMNKSSHLILPEINKVSDTFTELLKDLGEGKEAVYKTLDESKKPIWFRINAKPFISSIADENDKLLSDLGDELLSRVTLMRTDSTVDLNIKVIESKFEKAQNPYLKKKGGMDDKAKKCLEYVKNLPDINHYTFIYPMGATMKTAIPPLFTDSRRDCDRYLDNTYGITLFNKYNRIQFGKDGKLNLVVTPLDAWYNHIIYGDLLIQSALKCSFIEKIILDILVKYCDLNPSVGGMKLKEIHQSLLDNNFTPTVETVKKYCNNLYKHGYIIINDGGRPHTYEPTPFFRNKNYRIKVDWKSVIEESKMAIKKHFPSIADEYIKRFCSGDGLMGIHPFSGEKINITEYKEKEGDNLDVKKTVSDLFNWSPMKNEKTINSSLDPLMDKKVDLEVKKEEDNEDDEIEQLEEVEDIITEEKDKKEETNEDKIIQFIKTNGKDNEIDSLVLEEKFTKKIVEEVLHIGTLYESRNGFYKLL